MSLYLCRPTPILRCFLAAALLIVCGDRSSQAQAQQAPAKAAPAGAVHPTAGTPCQNPPPCGGKDQPACSNTPFVPTECWTTQYGPAKADAILKVKNLLYCNAGAPYALCFFSGPPYATGNNPATNNKLPCTLKDGVASCTCQVYTTGPSFVDINGILNQGVYYETVNACGPDGSGCANLLNCGKQGEVKGCSKRQQAPVCKYVEQQDPNNPSVSLMPKADLVSTFSFAMKADYTQGSTQCAGVYAGCMTAPCFFGPNHNSKPTNGELIQCECPIFNGKYQIGQKSQSCAIASPDSTTYVWSASYSPISKPAGKNKQ